MNPSEEAKKAVEVRWGQKEKQQQVVPNASAPSLTALSAPSATELYTFTTSLPSLQQDHRKTDSIIGKRMSGSKDPAFEQKLTICAQLETEAAEMLRAEGLTPAQPIPAPKSGGSGVGDVEVITNIHGLKCARQIPVYRYDVTITGTVRKPDGSERFIHLTKKCAADSVSVDCQDRCRDVYLAFANANRDFLKNTSAVYYDLQSIMYSLNLLDVPQDAGKLFEVPSTALPAEHFGHFVKCAILIRQITKDFQLAVGDVTRVLGRNLDNADRSLIQFFDLATSQHMFFNPDTYVLLSSTKCFLLEPNDFGFSNDDICFFPDNGSYLALGVQKSVRIMEGPKKAGSAAIVVETKKTPFHVVENLLDKVKRMVPNIRNLQNSEFSRIEKICTGLYVKTNHLNREQRFRIRGIERDGADRKLINIDGVDMTVEEYFRKKYEIHLQEPSIPLLRARGAQNLDCYVPIELCVVVDNQRLSVNQQTPKQIQDMIKKCAVPPATLLRHNRNMFNAMDLSSSEYLKNAGISFIANEVSVRGASLPAPNLEFANRFIAKPNPNNFTWQGRGFLIPMSCSHWVVYAFLGYRDRMDREDLKRFINRFVEECKSRGMRIAQPADFQILSTCNPKELENRLKIAVEQQCNYALIIHSDSVDDMHSYMKYYERKYAIITQGIRCSTFNNMATRGQPLTLQNIVNKTNIKLGGLNFTLSITSPGAKAVLNDNILFIGVGVNHPGLGGGDDAQVLQESITGKTPPPSVVGYCANIGLADNFEYVGDFLLQPLREEKMGLMRKILMRCVESYRRNRSAEPKAVVMYRNGASEGNFSMILRLEIPLIKSTMKKLDCNANLVVVIPNKLQSIRFVPADVDAGAKPPDQNVKPGLVVDHSIVHPNLCEFYLNSHRALQGTARTPRYTVLVNESPYTLKDIEQFTYALCYGHQIVNMPTSLPTPVFVALRYAERGRKLYNKYMQSSEHDDANSTYENINEALGYYDSELFGTRRVNA